MSLELKNKISSQDSLTDEKHVVSRTLTDGVEQSDCILTDEELKNILNIFEGEDAAEQGKKREQNAKTPPPSPFLASRSIPPVSVCAPSPQVCSPFLEHAVPSPLNPLHNVDNTQFWRGNPHVSRFELPMNFDERQFCIERRMAMRPEVELLHSYSNVPSQTISQQGSLNKILNSQSEVVRSSSSSSELNQAQKKKQKNPQKKKQKKPTQKKQQQQQQSPQQSKVQKTGSGTGSASGPISQTSPPAEQNAGKNKKGIKEKKDSTKANQSHSLVEKQRRDRINQLIDELRELIPPQHLPDENLHISVSEVANSRPKHNVLNDTIIWVKVMQEQLNCLKNEMEIIRSNSGGIMDLCRGLQNNKNNNNMMQSIEDRWFDPLQAASHSMQNSHRNLGVYIEPNPKDTNSMFVKISCKDRAGLLFDVVSTFLGISVFVKSAVITSDPVAGLANSVFEVTGNAMDDVWRDYVQQCLFHSVFVRQGEGREFKRLRSGDMGRSEEMFMSEY